MAVSPFIPHSSDPQPIVYEEGATTRGWRHATKGVKKGQKRYEIRQIASFAGQKQACSASLGQFQDCPS
jgi:hypothetical protein